LIVKNWLWKGAAATLLLAGPAVADDPPKKADPPGQGQKDPPRVPAKRLVTKDDAQKEEENVDPSTPYGKYLTAKKAVSEKSRAFSKVIADERTKGAEISLKNEAIAAANKEMQKAQDAANAAGVAFVKSDPKAKQAFTTIRDVVMSGAATPDVFALLEEHFITNDKLPDLFRRLSYGRPTPELEKFLRAVIEKHPKRDAQGQASLALATLLLQSDKKAAEQLLEKIAAEYGDVKSYKGSLAVEAQGQLFEMRHLQVGMVVPDIEGEDLEGKQFKLSDYRGKVVMLDFWGHW